MGPAKVFEDRLGPGDWRVEWVDVTASYSVMAAGFAIQRGRRRRVRLRSIAALASVSLTHWEVISALWPFSWPRNRRLFRWPVALRPRPPLPQ